MLFKEWEIFETKTLDFFFYLLSTHLWQHIGVSNFSPLWGLILVALFWWNYILQLAYMGPIPIFPHCCVCRSVHSYLLKSLQLQCTYEKAFRLAIATYVNVLSFILWSYILFLYQMIPFVIL